MKKMRISEMVLLAIAAVSLLVCGRSLLSNLGGEDAPLMMLWYLSLYTVIFALLAVLAVLELLFHDRLLLKKLLYGAVMVVGTVYTALVIVDCSPFMTEFFAKELWRSATSVLTFAGFIIYLAVGVLAVLLCFNKLSGRRENQRSFGWMLCALAVLSIVPTVIFSFQYEMALSLRLTSGVSMLLIVLAQAVPVYTVFCRGKAEE